MTEPNGAPIAFALFEPDIPQNTGNLIRTGACFGMQVHVIEPCGFVLSDSRMRRAGMDYAERAALVRHASWQAFNDKVFAEGFAGRIVLLSTKADTLLQDFSFQPGDILLLGRESAGVPDHVHDSADARVKLPMADGLRSMNVAVSGAITAFEALRQLQALPGSETIAT
mgnify:CR=1 FL=1|tara:strand:+ start:42320 stop:42826 length:507 start_codon:yes stop_codon:yes gene_type:complete